MSDIDLDKYRRHVAHFNLSPDKETELLAALWHILQNFVDRAFGEDAVQLAMKAGVDGLEGNSPPKDASRRPSVVGWPGKHPDSDNQTKLADAFPSTDRTRGPRKR